MEVAILLLVAIVGSVLLWLARPNAAQLAGATWIVAALLLAFLGLIAAAVNVAAIVVVWPLAIGFGLLGVLLLRRPVRVVLLISAIAAALFLCAALLSAATSSPAFQDQFVVMAAVALPGFLASVWGLWRPFSDHRVR